MGPRELVENGFPMMILNRQIGSIIYQELGQLAILKKGREKNGRFSEMILLVDSLAMIHEVKDQLFFSL